MSPEMKLRKAVYAAEAELIEDKIELTECNEKKEAAYAEYRKEINNG